MLLPICANAEGDVRVTFCALVEYAKCNRWSEAEQRRAVSPMEYIARRNADARQKIGRNGCSSADEVYLWSWSELVIIVAQKKSFGGCLISCLQFEKLMRLFIWREEIVVAGLCNWW